MGLQPSVLSLTNLALFVILFVVALRWHGKQAPRFRAYFLVMAVSYFIAGAIELAGYNTAISGYPIYPLQAMLSALVFSFFASELSGVVRLKYVSLALSALVFILPLPGGIARASYLVSVIVGFLSFFILYEFSHGRIRHAGLLGLIATCAGAFILFAGMPEATFERFWFVPNIFLAAGYLALVGFVTETSRFLLPRKIEFEFEEPKAAIKHVVKPLFYLIIYLSLLNVVLILGTLALHESGHLWAGSKLGCTGEIVLFDSSQTGPHTTLSCPQDVSKTLLEVAGLTFALPFALLFFLLHRYPERNFGVVILGLSLLMSALDFSTIFPVVYAAYAFVFAGVLLICIGEALLINAYISTGKKREEKREAISLPGRNP